MTARLATALGAALLLILAAPELAEAAQQVAAKGRASHLVWWQIALLVMAPLLIAMFLTMSSVVFIRRMNRSAMKPPMQTFAVLKWAAILGSVYGLAMQFGLQRAIADFTATRVYPEFLIIAGVLTGPLSVAVFEFVLKPYLRAKHPSLLAAVQVKHRSDLGHEGDTEPSDATIYQRAMTSATPDRPSNGSAVDATEDDTDRRRD